MKNIARVKLIEMNNDSSCSNFFTDNWEEIRKAAVKVANITPDNIDDIMLDVYESILKMERNGKPFSFCSDNGHTLSIKEFILCRMKLYAKNTKYHIGWGNEIPACNISEEDGLNLVQYALANAVDMDDDIGLSNDRLDMIEELRFVVMHNDKYNTVGFLKNLEFILKGEIDISVFNSMKDASEEFKEAFRNVVKYFSDHAEAVKLLDNVDELVNGTFFDAVKL